MYTFTRFEFWQLVCNYSCYPFNDFVRRLVRSFCRDDVDAPKHFLKSPNFECLCSKDFQLIVLLEQSKKYPTMAYTPSWALLGHWISDVFCLFLFFRKSYTCTGTSVANDSYVRLFCLPMCKILSQEQCLPDSSSHESTCIMYIDGWN